ncbi:MAG: hypothetical protein LBL00_03230, partial [Endomicrobium sp.]|nr:hypothetical protein [Endomicrobium sp.]
MKRETIKSLIRKSLLKKAVAVLVLNCFLFSFCFAPALEAALDAKQAGKEFKQVFEDFVLPYSYGKITDSHLAGSDRVIINIQDLHCHPKVQKNISKIIEQFDKSFGIENVYLEGAYGDIDSSWLTVEKNSVKRKEILEAMIKTGRLTGAEYFSALSGRTDLIKGLEAKEPYLENLQTFGWLVTEKEKIDTIIASMEKSMLSLKNKYYNKRQFKLEKLHKEYSAGKISGRKYFAVLSKHIDRLGVNLNKYPNTLLYLEMLERERQIDYKAVNKELSLMLLALKEKLPFAAYKMLMDSTSNLSEIDKLYGYLINISQKFKIDLEINFPSLNEYFKYIDLSQKINPLELVSEEQRLNDEINSRFSDAKAQREVVFLTGFHRYIKNFLEGKITASDYEYYAGNIETYKTLYAKYVDNKVLSLLDKYLNRVERFYEINVDRNKYFAQSLGIDDDLVSDFAQAGVLSDGRAADVINSMKGKRVDIMVTGGFHTSGISQLLKSGNVSYIVITPNVEGGVKEAEETYYKVAKEQSKIDFQALANMIAGLSIADQIKLWSAVDRDAAIRIYGLDEVNKYAVQSENEVLDEEKAKLKFESLIAEILDVDEAADKSMTAALVEKIKNNLSQELAQQVDEGLISKMDMSALQKAFEDDIDSLESIVRNTLNKNKDTVESLYENMKLFAALVKRSREGALEVARPAVDAKGRRDFKTAIRSRALAAFSVTIADSVASITQKFAVGLVGSIYGNGKWLSEKEIDNTTADKQDIEIVSERAKDIQDASGGQLLDMKATEAKSAKINKLLREKKLAQKAWEKLAISGIKFDFEKGRFPPVVFVQAVSADGKQNVKLDFHGEKIGTGRVIMIDAGVFKDTSNESQAVEILAELLSHEGAHVENYDNDKFQVHNGQYDGN